MSQPQQQPQQQQLEIQYVNRPEVSETFADILEKLTVDGATNTLRMEFCVVRMDDPKVGSNVQTGKKYTASRLVLPMSGLLDMINKFQQIASVMEQQGMLNRQTLQPIMTPQGSGKPN
jgi:hypothetical protein